jgi:hypothetical protein
MGKRNVKTDKEAAGQPETNVQSVQETAGNSDTAQTAPVEPEGGEKELQVRTEQSGGEQTNGKGSAGMDSEIQETATGEEGGGAGDQVNDDNDREPDGEALKEKTEKRNRISADVFSKHSHRNALYFTGDMIPFFEESDAIRHAASLKDGTVVTVNRE